MSDSEYPVETKHLYKSFDGKEVLCEINLKIRRGELYVLTGPDGAGKTTLLRILAGVVDPTSGDIFILSRRIPQEISKIKGEIEYMPQRFSLYGDLTVEENLDFYRNLYGIEKDEWIKKRERLLSVTKLKGFERRKAQMLSGGMQKKLALSIALIPSPKILLLDEPTTGVDPISRRELWELLQELILDGVTIILTTPYLDEAYKAHRVGFLFNGRILLEGNPEKLLKSGYSSLDDLFFDLVKEANVKDQG